jgi:voltage-gated potassium channel
MERIKDLFGNPTVKAILFFLIALFVFALGYSLIEGIGFFDAIYWAVTTSSTVGYGDISPVTVTGKIFTMLVMVTGVGILGYLISNISSHLMEMNMNSLMGLGVSKKKNHTIILGWNILAKTTLHELVCENEEIVVVDDGNHPEINSFAKTQFIRGEINNPDVLKKAGINQAKQVFISSDDDSLVVMSADFVRKMNSKVLIAGRIRNVDFAPVAKSAGCDRVVLPAEIGGNLIYSALHEPSVTRWILEVIASDNGAYLREISLKDRTELIGMKVREVENNSTVKSTLVAISNNGKIESIPDLEYVLTADDVLIYVEKDVDYSSNTKTHVLKSESENGSVLVCGWNDATKSAVEELVKEQEVTVLTADVGKSEKAYFEEHGVKFVLARVNKYNLIKAGIKKVDNIILGMRDDSKVVLMSYLVRSLNADANLVARIDDSNNYDAAYSSGVDHIVSPSEAGGRLLALSTKLPNAVEWIMRVSTLAVGAKLRDFPIVKSSKYIGMMIGDIALKNKIVVGLDKNSDALVESLPSKETVVEEGDTLVLLEK